MSHWQAVSAVGKGRAQPPIRLECGIRMVTCSCGPGTTRYTSSNNTFEMRGPNRISGSLNCGFDNDLSLCTGTCNAWMLRPQLISKRSRNYNPTGLAVGCPSAANPNRAVFFPCQKGTSCSAGALPAVSKRALIRRCNSFTGV